MNGGDDFKSYRKESKIKDWGSYEGKALSIDQIKLGAVLRMADSLEIIASNINLIINENARLKTEKKHLENVVSGYKGTVTRLKKEKSKIKGQVLNTKRNNKK